MSGPEEIKFTERLRQKMAGEDGKRLTNMTVFWGDKAHELTREERFAALNDLQDKIDRGETRETCGCEIDGMPHSPRCKFYQPH